MGDGDLEQAPVRHCLQVSGRMGWPVTGLAAQREGVGEKDESCYGQVGSVSSLRSAVAHAWGSGALGC